MTTDAKIGLLLALVFIVAITFVINGLPDFLSKKDKPDLTGTYIGHYSKPEEPGIIDRSSREAAALLNKKTIVSAPVSEPVAETNTTQSGENYQQTIIPAASEVVKSSTPQTTAPQQSVAMSVPAAASSAVESVMKDTAMAAKVDGKIYEVADGDSLVSIAQKVYGPKAGAKYANIQNIYEANKNTMKSRDSLQIGQKLVIPSLSEKEQALVNTGFFEKAAETPKAADAPKKIETAKADARKAEDAAAKDSKALKDYVVKENDTLWKIAVKYLGDGNRYDEIAQLNKTINPDRLVVGTKLKLPAR